MRYWGRETRDLLERLEGQLSRAVLRGPRDSNAHSATRPLGAVTHAVGGRDIERTVEYGPQSGRAAARSFQHDPHPPALWSRRLASLFFRDCRASSIRSVG